MNLSELIGRSGKVSFSTAIILLQPVYLYAHNWNKTDKVAEVVRKNEDYIRNKILLRGIDCGDIKGEYIYKQVMDIEGVPEIDPVTEDVVTYLDMFESWVDIITLINYVYKDVGDIRCIPIELQQFVYEESDETDNEAIKPEYDPKIDEPVCKGIAKTLWYFYPQMDIKQIVNHPLIQEYGNGKHYKDPKTVSGWVSKVDTRPSDKKRGPKKNDEK